jgi:hypothetical protein
MTTTSWNIVQLGTGSGIFTLAPRPALPGNPAAPRVARKPPRKNTGGGGG